MGANLEHMTSMFKAFSAFSREKNIYSLFGQNTAVQLKCHSTLKCIIYMFQSKMQMPTSPCKVSVNFKYDAFCLPFLYQTEDLKDYQNNSEL